MTPSKRRREVKQQETKTELPIQVEGLVYGYAPATGARLSKSRESSSRQRLAAACPPSQRPEYVEDRKQWYCHMHPVLPPPKGAVRCCLPPVVSDESDLQRVWQAILDPTIGNGKFTYYNANPSGGTFGAPVNKSISPSAAAQAYGEFASKVWSGTVDYLRFPTGAYGALYLRSSDMGLLMLRWPWYSWYDYFRYLIASDLPEDLIVEAMMSSRPEFRIHSSHVLKLLVLAEKNNKRQVYDFLETMEL